MGEEGLCLAVGGCQMYEEGLLLFMAPPETSLADSSPQPPWGLTVDGLAGPLLLLNRGLVRVCETAVSDCENNFKPGR